MIIESEGRRIVQTLLTKRLEQRAIPRCDVDGSSRRTRGIQLIGEVVDDLRRDIGARKQGIQGLAADRVSLFELWYSVWSACPGNIGVD